VRGRNLSERVLNSAKQITAKEISLIKQRGLQRFDLVARAVKGREPVPLDRRDVCARAVAQGNDEIVYVVKHDMLFVKRIKTAHKSPLIKYKGILPLPLKIT